MKKICILLFIVSSIVSFGQMGINTASPDASAYLHVQSTDRGFLMTRVSLQGATDLTTIANPAEGLIVFNLADDDNGTPADVSDDVFANNVYYFSEGKWSLLLDGPRLAQLLSDMPLPKVLLLANMIASPTPPPSTDIGVNGTTYLSNDLGTNIRIFKFDNPLRNVDNAFDLATNSFKAPQDGYYYIIMNVLLRPNSPMNLPANNLKLGISDPFTGTFPTSGLTASIFNDASLTANPSTGANVPAYMNFTKIIYLQKDQKIVPLTQGITPGTIAGTYSLIVEAINYNRHLTNSLTIILLPNDTFF